LGPSLTRQEEGQCQQKADETKGFLGIHDDHTSLQLKYKIEGQEYQERPEPRGWMKMEFLIYRKVNKLN
jgi:hypothetical protein